MLLTALAITALAGVGSAQPKAPAATPAPAAGQKVSCPAQLRVTPQALVRGRDEEQPKPLSLSEIRPDGVLTCTYALDLNGAAATLSFPGQCGPAEGAGWSRNEMGLARCTGTACEAVCAVAG